MRHRPSPILQKLMELEKIKIAIELIKKKGNCFSDGKKIVCHDCPLDQKCRRYYGTRETILKGAKEYIRKHL